MENLKERLETQEALMDKAANVIKSLSKSHLELTKFAIDQQARIKELEETVLEILERELKAKGNLPKE